MRDETNITIDVLREVQAQDEKWGADRNQSDGMWALILGEEFGEACQAALQDHDALEGELIQVAAVAMQWIANLRWLRSLTDPEGEQPCPECHGFGSKRLIDWQDYRLGDECDRCGGDGTLADPEGDQ